GRKGFTWTAVCKKANETPMIERLTTVDCDGAVASAIRTVETETAGLVALSAALEGPLYEAFRDAVCTIGQISGRVVVSGIGKSGHVGAKIAATLASTGTPSFFVHPVEANHGDLGMPRSARPPSCSSGWRPLAGISARSVATFSCSRCPGAARAPNCSASCPILAASPLR